MEELLILLLFILITTIIVIPIVSLVKLSDISSRLRDIEKELKHLKASGLKTGNQPEEPQTIQSPAQATITPFAPVEKEQPAITVEQTEELPAAVVITEKVEELPSVVEETPREEIKQTIKEEETPTQHNEEEVPVQDEVPVFTMPSATDDPEEKYIYETVWTQEDTPTPKKKKEMSSFRFENLLSKIGIVTLVLGIAFFVKYAIDKDWINEVGRVAIGVLTGGALIGIAHQLRKKYDLFSAIMVGGGVSVLYITITLAFREYHLFSQTLAFIILIAITIFSVILSLVYNRKELALFSLLGGYASPLMISTGEGNYVVLFSFLLILNTGMLLISMRKKWGIIGIVSFVCTLLFYWGWLIGQFETQYKGALLFGVLFFVQFYLLALFDHFLSGKKVSLFQVSVILANNLSLFAAAIYIFKDTTMNVQGPITICMALVNAIVMIALFRKVSVDKRLIYLIIAIVLSFVSLAVPMQLNGHVITMFWAAEIVILIWLWKKSGIRVFYVGFLLISALTLISYFMDAYHLYFQEIERLPVIFNRMFVTGIIVVAAFVISKLLLGRMKESQEGSVGQQIIHTGLTLSIIVISYLVPFMEIAYQFERSLSVGVSDFTSMILAVYTTIYVAILAIIFRKKIQQTPWMFGLLFTFVGLYLAFAVSIMTDLRYEVFNYGRNQTLFLTHYLALLSLAYIVYVLGRSIKTFSKQASTVLAWLLVAASVFILSVELDSTVIQLWGTADNYDNLLYDVHTFGYPILWGILAMILMIWGLKAKEALLRQISLGFFAFIILKFYVSDIWLMSQTGRIISFVVLGIILLLVSFLIQKIKVLIKDDEKHSKNLDEVITDNHDEENQLPL